MYPPMHLAGAEMMLHAILRRLVALGWECRVCCIGGRGYRYGIGEDYTLDGILVTEDEVRALTGTDAILTHLDRTPESQSIAAYLGVPLVHLIHNHLTLQVNRVHRADLVVYNSDWIADRVRWPAPSVVVHPPVYAGDYRVKPTGTSYTLVNLQIAKGVKTFYALAERLPDRSFLGIRGAYGAQVEDIRANVAVLPPQADMRRVYRRTRILLMPSSYESYGRCAVEAAASGIPTIAAPTPGLREALGDAAVYVEPGNVAGWHAAIERVEAEWPEWSARARARFEELDPDSEIDALDRVLAGMVA